MQPQLVLSLLDLVELVTGDIEKHLVSAAWPSNLDPFRADACAHPKVQSQIVLGEVAASAHNLANLRIPVYPHCNARAHGIAIAPSPHQFEGQEVVPWSPAVVQQ